MRSSILTLATAGLFLLSLDGAQAQREVEPPAIPPMLEGQRPLAQPETKEVTPPKAAEESKTKGKGQVKATQSGVKSQPQVKGNKSPKKKPAKVATKKGQKNHKKKRPPATAKQAGPGEG